MKKEIQNFTLTQTHHKDIKSHIPRCQSIPLTPKRKSKNPKKFNNFQIPKTLSIEILKSKKKPPQKLNNFHIPEFQKPKPLSKIHHLPANIPFVTQNPDTKTTPTPQRKPRKPKIQSFQKKLITCQYQLIYNQLHKTSLKNPKTQKAKKKKPKFYDNETKPAERDIVDLALDGHEQRLFRISTIVLFELLLGDLSELDRRRKWLTLFLALPRPLIGGPEQTGSHVVHSQRQSKNSEKGRWREARVHWDRFLQCLP